MSEGPFEDLMERLVVVEADLLDRPPRSWVVQASEEDWIDPADWATVWSRPTSSPT